MDVLCKSTFWDLNVTWYSENPQFTPCFRQTALVWIPCIFLWIFSPFELYYLKKSECREIPYNVFNITKLVLIIIASLLRFTDSIHLLLKNFQPFIYFYSIIIECITLVLFFILTWANIKRGIRSSGVLFIFSFLLVMCGTPEIKTIIENGYSFSIYNENNVKSASYTLYYICIVIILLINCFADEEPRPSLSASQQKNYPSKEASFLSKLFLIWFDAYVWRYHNQPVKSFLWCLDPKDCTKDVSIRHQKKLKMKNRKNALAKPSIVSILHKEVGFHFWLCTALRMLYELFTNSLFFIYDWLLLSLQMNEPIWKAYFYTGLFFVNIIIQSIIMTKYVENNCRVEIHLRNTVISCLYKKALHISNAVKQKYSTSDIVNLMSIDTLQLQNSVKIFHYFVSFCMQIIVSYLYLWYLLGNTIIIGIWVTFGTFLLGYLLTRHMKRLQVEAVKNKDTRSKFMHEILSGIRVLKMYAWELSFEKVAVNLRQKENETLRKIANTNTMLQIVSLNSAFLVSLVAYVSYVLITQNVMNARITLVSFLIFCYFRIAFDNIPRQVLFLQQVKISIKRINKFLNTEELDESAISHNAATEPLIMENASFSWASKNGPVVLENMNIKIADSSLIAIVGPVGAGKSSLISAFLGEMYKVSGYVNTRGRKAYVPQQAWILNATIKENITLGDDIDKDTYEQAIEACALRQDLYELSDGDLTEIGEKGINLSGGQKQRISLARAICQNADIYFFDDPLSAVDSQVANHIFQNVFGSSGLLKNKTRILVTHSTKFFPLMDEIVVLKNGHISEIGTYEELLNNESDFMCFVRTHIETEKLIENEPQTSIERTLKEFSTMPKELKKKPINNLIREERVKSKQVNYKLYWTYFKMGGQFLTFVSLFLLFAYHNVVISSITYLSTWVSSDESFETRVSFVVAFTLYGLIQVILLFLSSYIFFKINLKACGYFYHTLLNNVLHWPMSSFDTIPVGRIISRVSDDMYTLDNFIALKMFDFLTAATRLCSIIFYLIITNPWSSIVIIPFNIISFILRKYFVGLSHQLKRIEMIHKAPLYSHLVETVAGIPTIRAFGLQDKFTSRCYKKNDLYSASYQSSAICIRWYTSKNQFLEAFVVVGLTTLVLFERKSMNFHLVALNIAYILQLIRGTSYMFDVFDEVEENIIAVERLNEFIALPQEPDWNKSSISVPDTWPDKGEIVFQDYKLRYRQGQDLVLKGISLTIKSGEKVGIIGRTGAGKSSIIQGLFRIIEPASGMILIDNVEIIKVGLHALRSRLTVIPQDPTLFYGTLRFNLDPFGNYHDVYLWDALEKSHLKNFVQGLPEGLDYVVDEGGQNLSLGQRQLICLARALLRKSKILMLDEATASVDVETDELIQQTICNEFSDCTVVTIAHRLDTLQNYDKILMLDEGQVLNFDSTDKLLGSSNSQYHRNVLELGLK